MTTQPVGTGRLARLFGAADRRQVPLRTILVTVGVVVATYLAGKLMYLVRDIVLLMLVAGFVAMLLNPAVAKVQRRVRRRGLAPTPDPPLHFSHGLGRAGLHRPGLRVRCAAGERDHPSGRPDARLYRQRAAR
jgi:hypothetical protein